MQTSTANEKREYLPAAGRDIFLPFYDPIVRLLGGNATRRRLIDQANLSDGHHVLEIGCGTGALMRQIHLINSNVHVTGLDPDPKALARARTKLQKAGARFGLDQGFSDQLPYSSGSFDHVFSSFMFHHLPMEEKQQTLLEVRRVLKQNGSYNMLDFGISENDNSLFARRFHSSEHLKHNYEENVIMLLKRAEFSNVQISGRGKMLFFRIISYYRADK